MQIEPSKRMCELLAWIALFDKSVALPAEPIRPKYYRGFEAIMDGWSNTIGLAESIVFLWAGWNGKGAFEKYLLKAVPRVKAIFEILEPYADSCGQELPPSIAAAFAALTVSAAKYVQ